MFTYTTTLLLEVLKNKMFPTMRKIFHASNYGSLSGIITILTFMGVTHTSSHFWMGTVTNRKEDNVLFNNILNTLKKEKKKKIYIYMYIFSFFVDLELYSI